MFDSFEILNFALPKVVFSTVGIVVLAGVAKIFVSRLVLVAVDRVDDGDDSVDTSLERRAKTLGSIGNNVAKFVIWGTAFVTILSEWGVNIAPILAGAGVVGLAVGFGAQTLVKDVVTGFFILLENQFNIGDKVEIAGLRGKVLSMNLRTTVLKGEDGATHVIPNSKISTVTKS